MNREKIKFHCVFCALVCYPFAIATIKTFEGRLWGALAAASFGVYVYVARKD